MNQVTGTRWYQSDGLYHVVWCPVVVDHLNTCASISRDTTAVNMVNVFTDPVRWSVGGGPWARVDNAFDVRMQDIEMQDDDPYDDPGLLTKR